MENETPKNEGVSIDLGKLETVDLRLDGQQMTTKEIIDLFHKTGVMARYPTNPASNLYKIRLDINRAGRTFYYEPRFVIAKDMLHAHTKCVASLVGTIPVKGSSSLVGTPPEAPIQNSEVMIKAIDLLTSNVIL